MRSPQQVIWIFFISILIGIFVTFPQLAQCNETGMEGIWKYRIGDSPVDANGNFLWLSSPELKTAATWSEFSYPGKPALPDDTYMVWMHTKLPKTAVMQPTLFFSTTDESFSVYLDDQLLYQYGDLAYSRYSFGMVWHLIELPPDFEGKTVSFRLYSNYPDALGIVDRLSIDSGSEQMVRLLKHDMMYVLSFPVAVFMVMIMISCYISTQKHKWLYMNIIIFFSLLSLWIVAASDAKQLLFNWPVFWWYVLLFTVYSMPIFLLRIIYKIINDEFKKWVKRVKQYYVCLWIVVITGEIFVGGAMHHFLSFFYLTAAPLQMVICYQVGISALKGNRECKALFVGVISLPLLALYDVLGSHFRVIPWFTHCTPLSAFAFALFILQMISHKISTEQYLAMINSHLKNEVEIAVQQSMIDPLTNCFNRNKLKQELERQVYCAKQNYLPLSMLMLDIDFFKKVNDECGHETGDRVLTNFAHVIHCRLREGKHLLVRYGGEEFMVLCTDTDLRQAAKLAEEIRIAVEQYPFIPDRVITCSIGVSEWRPLADGEEDQFLRRVDLALYAAKERGRNRVVVETELSVND